jgi:hypothetical protein
MANLSYFGVAVSRKPFTISYLGVSQDALRTRSRGKQIGESGMRVVGGPDGWKWGGIVEEKW